VNLWEVINDLGGRVEDGETSKIEESPVRVLLPTGEVYDVVGTEYDTDNQHGDVMYIRTELHE
jgi:hypothetical protein